MRNRYPLWKNLFIILILILGIIYALPNIFGEKPSIQISGLRGKHADISTLSKVEDILKKNNISFTGYKLENGILLLNFQDPETQIAARELVDQGIGRNYSVALNLIPNTPSLLDTLGGKPMSLGLDLRGGVNFLMEVDVKSLFDKEMGIYYESIPVDFIKNDLKFKSIELGKESNLNITFNSNSDLNKALIHLRKNIDFDIKESNQHTLNIKFSNTKILNTTNLAVDQSLLIIRNRVTELGVAEPVIQRQGLDKIVVELPGIQDTAKAKEIIGATATLSFHMVNQNVSNEQIRNNFIPANTIILEDINGHKYPIYRKEILSGEHIIDASSGRDQYGKPQVNIKLDSIGANIMSEATKTAIGKPMATVYSEYKDSGKKSLQGKTILKRIDEVSNVATIQARLSSNFVITGLSSYQEATSLALILKSGSLAAPIQIIQERTIGPSLGAENIKQGMKTSAYSLLAVMLFMIFIYKFSGLISSIVLIFNLILAVAVLSILPGTTLTMPGIAGLVLTIGMSVDANVLIYERIREELRNGQNIQYSLFNGYSGAWSSIFDANLTTILTAGILYVFGTGPIKGFAITLSVGVAISMFTAIVASKMLFNWIYGSGKFKNISI